MGDAFQRARHLTLRWMATARNAIRRATGATMWTTPGTRRTNGLVRFARVGISAWMAVRGATISVPRGTSTTSVS